ncbi:MAG: hypothetical protein GX896_06895 [Clostridiales bacterium]|nr:hypothetical protein [Clostridiales bacterium]
MLKINSVELSKPTVAVGEALVIKIQIEEIMPKWADLLVYKWDDIKNVTRQQLERGYIE